MRLRSRGRSPETSFGLHSKERSSRWKLAGALVSSDMGPVEKKLSAVNTIIVCPSLADNSLGRAYALSLILDELKLPWEVVATSGEFIWQPLEGEEFAKHCLKLTTEEVRERLRNCDNIIAVKPVPESLGLCISLGAEVTERLIIDVDDPDLELRLEAFRPLQYLARRILKPAKFKEQERIRDFLRGFPRIVVSNPALQEKYGGIIIPHVREAPLKSVWSPNLEEPYFLFLGTPRAHKGLRTVRRALRRIHRRGLRVKLYVTGRQRPLSPVFERRVGFVAFSDREKLLSGSLASIVLLEKEPFKSLQLPAKAIDALAYGVPLVHSRTRALDWALEGFGIALSTSSTVELEKKLVEQFYYAMRPPKPLSFETRSRFAPSKFSNELQRILRNNADM